MIKYFTFLVLIALSSCSSTLVITSKPLLETSYAINKQSLLRHLSYLADDPMQGRGVNTNGSILAQEYIIDQLKTAHIQPYKSEKFRHFFTFERGFKNYQAANIVGFIPAKTRTTKTIVLSAHYDHLGAVGSKVYFGADDNASGVAALLAMSKLLADSPLKHNVVILFTDAEEKGLKGAFHFVEHHHSYLDNYVLNINLDMLAGSSSTKVLRFISDDLIKIANRDIIFTFKHRHYNQNIKIKHGFKQAAGINKTQSRRSWQTASDHGAFYKKNIPFIYYGVGLHENYHTKNDYFQNVNTGFFWHSTNIIYDQLLFIDQHLIQ